MSQAFSLPFRTNRLVPSFYKKSSEHKGLHIKPDGFSLWFFYGLHYGFSMKTNDPSKLVTGDRRLFKQNLLQERVHVKERNTDV
jgi:hypothetical protein